IGTGCAEIVRHRRVQKLIRPLSVTRSAIHSCSVPTSLTEFGSDLPAPACAPFLVAKLKESPSTRFGTKQAARRLRTLAARLSMRRLVLSPGTLGGPPRGQKLNWNCCCCQLPTTDARAFALLARSRRWRRLIGLAKTH